jgi:Outer membrane protein beta-barrel domain
MSRLRLGLEVMAHWICVAGAGAARSGDLFRSEDNMSRSLACSLIGSFSIALLASCQSVPSVAHARSMEDVKQPNATRLGFLVSYDHSELEPDGGGSTSVDTVSIGADGGYRVTPNIEVGALVDYFSQHVEGGGDSNALLLGPSARAYLVAEGPVQPWVTASLGVATTDADGVPSESGAYVRAGVGCSYFLSKWVAVEGVLSYTHAGLDDLDVNSTALDLGISTFF